MISEEPYVNRQNPTGCSAYETDNMSNFRQMRVAEIRFSKKSTYFTEILLGYHFEAIIFRFL